MGEGHPETGKTICLVKFKSSIMNRKISANRFPFILGGILLCQALFFFASKESYWSVPFGWILFIGTLVAIASFLCVKPGAGSGFPGLEFIRRLFQGQFATLHGMAFLGYTYLEISLATNFLSTGQIQGFLVALSGLLFGLVLAGRVHMVMPSGPPTVLVTGLSVFNENSPKNVGDKPSTTWDPILEIIQACPTIQTIHVLVSNAAGSGMKEKLDSFLEPWFKENDRVVEIKCAPEFAYSDLSKLHNQVEEYLNTADIPIQEKLAFNLTSGTGILTAVLVLMALRRDDVCYYHLQDPGQRKLVKVTIEDHVGRSLVRDLAASEVKGW